MINNFVDKFIVREYKFKYLIFSVISGILLAFSFERFNIFPLAWIAFIPLIYCIYKNNFKCSVLYGFVTGIVFSLISFNWLFFCLFGIVKSVHNALLMAGIVWIYVSLYFCFWTIFINIIKTYRRVLVILFAASLWIVFEYIKNYFMTGFPINLLGYSQSYFYQIIQVADIFGIYGISFVIIIVNFLIFYWLKEKNKKYLLLSIIIILSLLIYGVIRISQISDMSYERELKIGIVQPNIDKNMKNERFYRENALKRLSESAQYFEEKNVNVILFPETILPEKLEKYVREKNMVKNIAKYCDIVLIGGKTQEKRKRHNTIFLVNHDGEIINKYKKKHRVFFGEYVPFEGFFANLFRRVNFTDSITNNEILEVCKVDDYVLGINICSENFYPYLSRELVLKGATLLTTHSNDYWAAGLSFPHQHFIMNVFRAIENRKYLAISGNTGISGVISPTGKILKQTKDLEQTAFEETVYTNNYITIYDRIGDLFVYLCMIYVLVILSFLLYTKIKNKKFFNGISKKSQQ